MNTIKFITENNAHNREIASVVALTGELLTSQEIINEIEREVYK